MMLSAAFTSVIGFSTKRDHILTTICGQAASAAGAS